MNKVLYFDSPQLLAAAAADYIVHLSAKSIKAFGKFTIALSGGNTPTSLYKLLAAEPYASKIDWKNIFVFWGDERCVSSDNKDNNSRNAKAVLLDVLPIPRENIFPIPVEFPPTEAAVKYETTIKNFFKTDHPKFDLVLLGMGDNGHTASLFPHTAVLHEIKALVKEVYVEELKIWRITFTARLINEASHILFLVSGKEKEIMLKKVLEGERQPEKYPAQLIMDAEWFVSL